MHCGRSSSKLCKSDSTFGSWSSYSMNIWLCSWRCHLSLSFWLARQRLHGGQSCTMARTSLMARTRLSGINSSRWITVIAVWRILYDYRNKCKIRIYGSKLSWSSNSVTPWCRTPLCHHTGHDEDLLTVGLCLEKI